MTRHTFLLLQNLPNPTPLSQLLKFIRKDSRKRFSPATLATAFLFQAKPILFMCFLYLPFSLWLPLSTLPQASGLSPGILKRNVAEYLVGRVKWGAIS